MTNKTTAVIVTVLVAALAIASPIWVAVRESRHQAISAEQARAMAYAEDVLHRSDAAAEQVNAGIARYRMTPEQALSLWQNSPAHHAVMINKDQWNKPWRALGVAVEGDYAVAWFGEEAD